MIICCPACLKNKDTIPGKYTCNRCGLKFSVDSNSNYAIVRFSNRDFAFEVLSISSIILLFVYFIFRNSYSSIYVMVLLLLIFIASIMNDFFDYIKYGYMVYRHRLKRKNEGLLVLVVIEAIRFGIVVFIIGISL
jgi:hypothetical protein